MYSKFILKLIMNNISTKVIAFKTLNPLNNSSERVFVVSINNNQVSRYLYILIQ